MQRYLPMKRYFEGWYYKHQANGRSLALIPGRTGSGAFVQVVTDEKAYKINYPLSDYRKSDILRVGGSIFSKAGVVLDIQHPELTLTGEILYKNLTPIRGDIMGPFRFLPMECRHGIVSMRHELSGLVTLDGEPLNFTGGVGYLESDSGCSFPERYMWAQCSDFKQDCSIMVSIARIPFCGLRFWGCICVVWLAGREYRLATYSGVKILRCEPGFIELRQGDYHLEMTVDTGEGHELAAPRLGVMSRVIRERLSCPAHFRFTHGNRILFDEKSSHTSYENVMR